MALTLQNYLFPLFTSVLCTRLSEEQQLQAVGELLTHWFQSCLLSVVDFITLQGHGEGRMEIWHDSSYLACFALLSPDSCNFLPPWDQGSHVTKQVEKHPFIFSQFFPWGQLCLCRQGYAVSERQVLPICSSHPFSNPLQRSLWHLSAAWNPSLVKWQPGHPLLLKQSTKTLCWH